MTCGLVIPSLGGSWLAQCLDAVTSLDPGPDRVVVVLSGGCKSAPLPESVEVVRQQPRLGFAAAVNTGIRALADEIDEVALLNDDAIPEPGWLGALHSRLQADPGLAAVQGTVTDAGGQTVDGRGIGFDRWGLPIQVDRGLSADPEPERTISLVAVSGTAALFRVEALHQVQMPGDRLLDQSFGSYHEDLDLGLRLRRLGWSCAWTAGARCRHLGSASGSRLCWRHPWWLLVNRWRALAGNLTLAALTQSLPRLLRGELRAVRTLMRDNLRAMVVALTAPAVLPVVIFQGWRRQTSGPRLRKLPEGDR
jgi:GT2 family glycosyltransferase